MPHLAPPKPNIVRCEYEKPYLPGFPCFDLDWNHVEWKTFPETWVLPTGVILSGPAPTRFGVWIRRSESDEYTLSLLWNETQFSWKRLTREQIKESCLGELLLTLETDLDSLLEQPLEA